MAIRDDNKPPTKGSITQTADRSIDRIGNISNVSKTVSNMQKDVKQRLTETQESLNTSNEIGAVQSSMVKVLQKLEDTVGALGRGVKTITLGTAKATSDSIREYGRAVSEDISFNRQNTVAMALSKTTPIFGYFVAKFMETSVYKSAAERIKRSIGSAFGGVINIVKRSISREEGTEKKLRSGSVKKVINKQLSKENIPHMAKGGVVKKGGMARLHAAEVVMPVDKFLSRIDESIDINKKLVKISEATQMATFSRLNKYVIASDLERASQKRGFFSGMFKALKDVETQYREPAQDRMLRAVLAIQDALGAQIAKFKQFFNKWMINSGAFRTMIIGFRFISGIFKTSGTAIYQIFKKRGGYKGHLSTNGNPFVAIKENIGVLYTGTMWRLDNIATFTRASAEAIRDLAGAVLGKAYPKVEGISSGRWSFFGATKGLLNWTTKNTVKLIGQIIGKQNSANALAEILTKKRYISSKRSRQLRETYGGSTEQEARAEVEDISLHKKFNRWYKAKLSYAKEKLISGRGSFERPEKAPFYQLVERWSKRYYKDSTRNEKNDPKQLKASNRLIELTGEQVKLSNKLKNKFKLSNVMLWFGFLKTILMKGFHGVLDKFLGLKSLLGKALFGSRLVGAGGAIKSAGGLFGSGGFFRKGGKLSQWGGKIGTKLPWLAKAAPWLARASGILSLGMGAWDMFKDVKSSKSLDWKDKEGGNLGALSKGLGAALGGTKSGLKGALGGVVKGAAIGAGIGTIVPVFGTAIGGAIGAIAGGILGFVGGKNIAKGMSFLGKHIKKMALAVWKFIKWPFTALWELLKKAKENIFGDTKVFSKEGILKGIKAYYKYIALWPITLGKHLVNKIKSWWSGEKETGNITGKTTNELSSIVTFPATALSSIKNYIKEKFNWENIKESIKGGVSKLTDMFQWFGSLFGKIKDFITEKVSNIPGVKWLIGKDKNTKEKVKEIADESKKSGSNIFNKMKGWFTRDKIKQITDATVSSTTNISRQARSISKQQYKNAVGFYEDANGQITNVGSKITDHALQAADKGKIVLTNTKLMLSNGDMIVNKLGETIKKSSEKLSETTMKSAGVVATTVNNVSNTISSSNVTSMGNAVKERASSARDYFDNIVFTGNYR